MGLNFREYKAEEKEEIKKMMFALKGEDSEEWPLDDSKIDLFFAYLVNNKKDKLFIAEQDGDIIGYAILIASYSLEFGGIFTELDELFIKPDYRSQGIGTRFIKWLENSAKESGSKVLGLEATLSNEKAQNLYKRLGYDSLPRILFIKELK